MDAKGAPALWPALGFLAGTCLAARLETLPGSACVLLTALGFALGHPAGRVVAFVALGLLNAQLRWLEPRAAIEALHLERPVVVVAEVISHPRRRDGELLLRARVRHVRQRDFVAPYRFEVHVTLPAAIPAPPLGATLRLKGYLRRSPGFANTPSVRPGPWRLRLKSHRFLEIVEPPGPLASLASLLRRKAGDAVARVARHGVGEAEESAAAGGPGLPLVGALIFGDRSHLPLAWQQTLRRYGLSHLLAVSGLHVGLLAALLYVLGQPLPRSARYVTMLAAVAVYLLLIGPRPSVLRASVMGFLALGALLLHRPPQAANALAWCVFVLVLPAPSVVTELGFQLSFAATAALVLLAPVYSGRWWRLPRWLRRPLAASFAAQVATLPLLVPYTGSCHPAAVFVNLVAIPWLGLFLLFAFPWLVVSFVSASAGAFFLPVLDALGSPLEGLARLPPTPVDLQAWVLPTAAAWAAAIGLAAAGRWHRAVPPVLLGLLSVSLTGAAPALEGPARLVALDVGQGDALLLRDGSHNLLVDGGGWPRGDLGGRVLLPALATSGVRRLDAVLLTHPDLDHCGGLADLVRYLPVGEVWTGPEVAGACVERLLGAPGPRHRVLAAGDLLRLGRWRLSVLHPEPGASGSTNDRSVVLIAELGAVKILLTGDVEAAAERALLARWGSRLRADVLKVAHHGSRTSTASGWLEAVAPRVALISAGPRNAYGHPSAAVLERLRRAGARALRTDLSGQVGLELYPDGRILIDLPWSPHPARRLR